MAWDTKRKKKVASWTVRFFGSKNAGSQIIVSSKKHDFKDEINFMGYNSGLEEYRSLKTEKNIVNLSRRNN